MNSRFHWRRCQIFSRTEKSIRNNFTPETTCWRNETECVSMERLMLSCWNGSRIKICSTWVCPCPLPVTPLASPPPPPPPPSLSLSLSLSLGTSRPKLTCACQKQNDHLVQCVLSHMLLLSFRSPRWLSGKASASRVEDPGLESRLRREFFGVASYQWLKNWHSSVYPARRLAL